MPPKPIVKRSSEIGDLTKAAADSYNLYNNTLQNMWTQLRNARGQAPENDLTPKTPIGQTPRVQVPEKNDLLQRIREGQQMLQKGQGQGGRFVPPSEREGGNTYQTLRRFENPSQGGGNVQHTLAGRVPPGSDLHKILHEFWHGGGNVNQTQVERPGQGGGNVNQTQVERPGQGGGNVQHTLMQRVPLSPSRGQLGNTSQLAGMSNEDKLKQEIPSLSGFFGSRPQQSIGPEITQPSPPTTSPPPAAARPQPKEMQKPPQQREGLELGGRSMGGLAKAPQVREIQKGSGGSASPSPPGSAE